MECMHHTSGIEMAQAHDVKFTLAIALAHDVDARRQFIASWLMPPVANHLTSCWHRHLPLTSSQKVFYSNNFSREIKQP